MRVIIAGSRDIHDYRAIEHAVRESGFDVTEVVSGTARGVDALGERWAEEHAIPVRRFPADWRRYGRSAGVRRNEVMADYAMHSPDGGALIAIWNGVSRGTAHMIDFARARRLQVFICHVPPGTR